MTISPQDFDQIAALAAKDEDMAAERIDVEQRLHNGSQVIEAGAHVGNTSWVSRYGYRQGGRSFGLSMAGLEQFVRHHAKDRLV